MTAVIELTKAAVKDLGDITEELLWCHAGGFDPTKGTDPDKPAGRPLPPRDPDAPEDHVPGSTWDIGMGDHIMRQAYADALVHIRTADGRLHDLLKRMGEQQPIRLRPSSTSPLAPVLSLVTSVRWRFVRLAHLVESTEADPPAVVDSEVKLARKDIDKAWGRLRDATQRGSADPDEQAVADNCRICGIRPIGIKKGGRCDVCHQWKVRNKFERPTKLDGVEVARAAHARRLRRGEGHGDESFSNTAPGLQVIEELTPVAPPTRQPRAELRPIDQGTYEVVMHGRHIGTVEAAVPRDRPEGRWRHSHGDHTSEERYPTRRAAAAALLELTHDRV